MNETLQALIWVGGVGALAGLVGGFVASADNLLGTILMGVIGSIVLASIVRVAGGPSIYGVGEENFSLLWGGVGGLILGFVVGKSNT